MVSSNRPLVSVCVPTYNGEDKLKLAIQKIQEQTYPNLEIIISDNFSSDGTQELCKTLVFEDERIKYFRHEKNHGPTVNFEFSRKKATGKYFLWHADDDYLDSSYIEMCVDELEKNQSCVLVSGVAKFRNNHKGEILYFGNIIQLDYSLALLRFMKYLWSAADNSIFYGVYRVEQIQDCHLPNVLAGDWIWVSQVVLKGRAKVIDSVFINRNFGDSTSASYERIVNTLKAPKWHSKYPWVAMTYNSSLFYIKDRKILLGVIAFFVVGVKAIWVNFKTYLIKILDIVKYRIQ